MLVDAETPSASRCTCAYFESRSKICKHIVAAYLAAFKGEALEFIENRKEQWEADDNWVKEQEESVQNYIRCLPRDELEELLMEELFAGPRWRLKKFVDYMEYDLLYDELYD